MPTRICGSCKRVKDLEKDFHKGPGYRGGYKPRCKECVKNYPSQTPEKNLERVYERRQRNRQFIWDYYKAHPCVDCGESDPLVLEPDHVRGNKLDNVAKLVHNTRSLKVIADELEKCEIVCANCHKRRTAATQGWYAGME